MWFLRRYLKFKSIRKKDEMKLKSQIMLKTILISEKKIEVLKDNGNRQQVQ